MTDAGGYVATGTETGTEADTEANATTAALRFLPCGESAMIVECADLDAALRLYAAIDAAVDTARSAFRGSCRDSAATTPTRLTPGASAITDGLRPTANRLACRLAHRLQTPPAFAIRRCPAGGGEMMPFAAVTTVLPAARTVYVAFDPLLAAMNMHGSHANVYELGTDVHGLGTDVQDSRADVQDFRSILQSEITNLHGGALKTRDSRVVEIPVVYDGEDLGNVAKLLGISLEQVVARHSGHPWKVAFGGFAPGFDYLVDGDPIFDVPRRKAPRLAVPAGSVGLAGTFSGVYPRASSGGWQLIGRTSVPMWNDAMDPPALLRPGDTVRFTPTRAEATIQRALQPDTPHVVPKKLHNASETLHDAPSTVQVDGSTMHNAPFSAPAGGTSPYSERRGRLQAMCEPTGEPMHSRPKAVHNRGCSREAGGGGQLASPTRTASATSSAPALEVVNPGILATFQDEGRNAPEMGVTGSGAADPRAFRLANELVGNPAHAPVIELTAGNASFTAHGDLTIAVTGAPVPITITAADPTPAGGCSREAGGGGHRTGIRRTPQPAFPITRQEAFLLRDGETVTIGTPTAGLRNYIAVRGGFQVPTILDSASTDTMSGIGPAPLKHGDLLPVRPVSRLHSPVTTIGLPQPWPDDLPRVATGTSTSTATGTAAPAPTELAVTLGPRDDWFTDAGIATFLGTTWTVTAQSNRVGLRLAAPSSVPAAASAPAATSAVPSVLSPSRLRRQPPRQRGPIPASAPHMSAAPAASPTAPATPAASLASPTIERRDPHAELKSEATIPGSIEVPGNGLPLIFLRDQPVTGGYPVIAVLTRAALVTAGQLPPGTQVRFIINTPAHNPAPLDRGAVRRKPD
ncbi:carboxyltransferase domain-containing protein [Bifidobacterium stellenboschense]|uniref:Urea amidolyase n=1 Tax=Bifidobacterium stellenboschense TaxID=762211 RepID=A0A087DN55_9BIFI|nr:carboxyltransferase domain-containing protein [Bifidobacterium stellenboschense]KFI96955.1 urea amidolyase [Bifidobacterium stellenboschense]